MAARGVTVVLAAMVLAVMTAVAVTAIKPEKAVAVPGTTVRTCDGGSIALEENEWFLLRLHNQARRNYGLEPFCVDPILTQAARDHSADMIARNHFGHGLVGSKLSSYGYNWVTYAENIGGYGSYSSPRSTFDVWMGSAGHHANIVNGSFEEIGIGMAVGEYNGIANYIMYTVDFGTQP